MLHHSQQNSRVVEDQVRLAPPLLVVSRYPPWIISADELAHVNAHEVECVPERDQEEEGI